MASDARVLKMVFLALREGRRRRWKGGAGKHIKRSQFLLSSCKTVPIHQRTDKHAYERHSAQNRRYFVTVLPLKALNIHLPYIRRKMHYSKAALLVASISLMHSAFARSAATSSLSTVTSTSGELVSRDSNTTNGDTPDGNINDPIETPGLSAQDAEVDVILDASESTPTVAVDPLLVSVASKAGSEGGSNSKKVRRGRTTLPPSEHPHSLAKRDWQSTRTFNGVTVHFVSKGAALALMNIHRVLAAAIGFAQNHFNNNDATYNDYWYVHSPNNGPEIRLYNAPGITMSWAQIQSALQAIHAGLIGNGQGFVGYFDVWVGDNMIGHATMTTDWQGD